MTTRTPAPDPGSQAALWVEGRAVPTREDPRPCPACAVVRWLDILGVADGLGRGSARMTLTAAHAPTATSPHRHTPGEPARWRDAAVLLPAIDRHGWLDDYRPITTRTIRTRLALTVERAAIDQPDEPPTIAPAAAGPVAPGAGVGPAEAAPDLEEVLTLLDDLADDADALNARIQALLGDPAPTDSHHLWPPSRARETGR